jgi:hypothetical protein
VGACCGAVSARGRRFCAAGNQLSRTSVTGGSKFTYRTTIPLLTPPHGAYSSHRPQVNATIKGSIKFIRIVLSLYFHLFSCIFVFVSLLYIGFALYCRSQDKALTQTYDEKEICACVPYIEKKIKAVV